MKIKKLKIKRYRNFDIKLEHVSDSIAAIGSWLAF